MNMEKRFRDYLKHFEKLDYDVLSDEEIQDEKSNLELKTAILHRELMRILVVIVGLFICASIFLTTGLGTGSVVCYCVAAVMGLCTVYFIVRYRSVAYILKKLDMFVDKLTLL